MTMADGIRIRIPVWTGTGNSEDDYCTFNPLIK